MSEMNADMREKKNMSNWEPGQQQAIADPAAMPTSLGLLRQSAPSSPLPNHHQSAIPTNTQSSQSQSHRGYARSKIFHNSAEFLGSPSLNTSLHGEEGTEPAAATTATEGTATGHSREAQQGHWQLFSVTLHRAHPGGFGIAISGGRDNRHGPSGDWSIVVSDVIASGPAFGLLHVGDRIVSANGACFENVDYSTAVCVMKDVQRLDMVVKRQMPPTPLGGEHEQRTLKFTLSKSRKKDDFGIILGCRYFIREITNPKLAEKDPGLKEGDTILRINGQSLEGVNLEEASRLLHRSRDKLSLVIQRDVRRGVWAGGGPHGSRWPSQTTVYERLGSLTATSRQSPSPVHHSLSNVNAEPHSIAGYHHTHSFNSSLRSNYGYNYPSSPVVKRFSDPMTSPQDAMTPQLLHHHPSHRHHYHHYAGYPTSPHVQQYTCWSAVAQPQQHVYYSPTPNNNYHPAQQRATVNAATYSHRLHESTHAAQSLTPSSVMTQSSAAGSPHSLAGAVPTMADSGSVSCHEDCSSATAPPASYHHNHHYPASTAMATHQQPQRRSAESSAGGGGDREIEVVTFRKGAGNLGIRVVGGNQVGIFVSAVQEESIAALNGILIGDRIHAVNGRNMDGATREEAVELLIGLTDEVCIHVEHQCTEAGQPGEFARVRDEQLGDSFYVRTHFTHKEPRRSNKAELTFQPGGAFFTVTSPGEPSQQHNFIADADSSSDIFHVTDTLCGGSVGNWQATKIYSSNEQSDRGVEPVCGIIPNAKSAELLAKQSRIDSSTLGRSIFKKKLLHSKWTKSLTTGGEELGGTHSTGYDMPLSAYERVVLKRPAFLRPVVLFGVLADVARQLLLSNFPQRFGSPQPPVSGQSLEEQVVRISTVDAIMAKQKHCVLNISPGSVDRLQLAQYAPIVLMIDVDSGSRVRELRSRCGATTLSARKLIEQASKLKKHHSHLLTATLDASKENGWFDALLHLVRTLSVWCRRILYSNQTGIQVFHLQERRVWMPEYPPGQAIEDLLLFPMQSLEAGDGDSLKGDYGVYDATMGVSQLESAKRLGSTTPICQSPSSCHRPSPSQMDPAAPTTSPHASSKLSPGGAPTRAPLQRSAITVAPETHTQHDVEQLLAEHYPPTSSTMNTSSHSHHLHVDGAASGGSGQQRPSARPETQPVENSSIWGSDTKDVPISHPHGEEVESASVARKRCDDLIAQLNFEAPLMDVAKSAADRENNNSNSVGGDRLPLTTTTAEFSLTKSAVNSGSPASTMRVERKTASANAEQPAVIESSCAVLDWRGGCLRCPQSGVELNVPQAAIPRGRQQEVFVKVCRSESAAQPPMLGDQKKELTISPLVMCGPSGLHFFVPVELKLPHSTTSNLLAKCGGSGEGSNGGPNFVLKSGSGSNWKNMELAKAPFKTSQDDSFITVLVDHF